MAPKPYSASEGINRRLTTAVIFMIASVPTVIFLLLGAILAFDIFILSNIFKIETYNYDINIKTNINLTLILKTLTQSALQK
ncbi:hypothetical protein VEE78_43260 (plasmid) [Escherichia coli]|nr:hypothetical protein VEE78_43260 [Escherichia coli]